MPALPPPGATLPLASSRDGRLLPNSESIWRLMPSEVAGIAPLPANILKLAGSARRIPALPAAWTRASLREAPKGAITALALLAVLPAGGR